MRNYIPPTWINTYLKKDFFQFIAKDFEAYYFQLSYKYR